MTDCERMSERMPEVALGRSPWSAEESEHLARCPECQAEWEVVRSAGGLGADLPLAQSDEVTARLVLQRISRERGQARRRRAGLVVGMAAAAALLLVVFAGRRMPSAPVVSVGSRAAPESLAQASQLRRPAAATPAGRGGVSLPELDELGDADLDLILRSIDDSAQTQPWFDEGGPGASDDAPDRALSAWEG